jgi:hypothetical protein
MELIALLAERCSGDLFIWTHFYDADLIARSGTAHKHVSASNHTYRGFEHVLHLYEYGRALDQQSFCGGSAMTSCWLSKADIQRGLEFFGFRDVLIVNEQHDHPNGPALSLMAKRRVPDFRPQLTM